MPRGSRPFHEALFLIQGLNAHDIYPDWIALNNGTTHGIEASPCRHPGRADRPDPRRHHALRGERRTARHLREHYERLREIAGKTRTTKANVATALQLISWGLEVNDTATRSWTETGTSSR